VVPRGRRRAGRRRRLVVVVGASVRVVVGVCAYLAEDALDVLDGSGAARGRGRVRAVVGAAGDVDEAAVDGDGAAEDEERDEGAEEGDLDVADDPPRQLAAAASPRVQPPPAGRRRTHPIVESPVWRKVLGGVTRTWSRAGKNYNGGSGKFERELLPEQSIVRLVD
jgi:hypothetical protein